MKLSWFYFIDNNKLDQSTKLNIFLSKLIKFGIWMLKGDNIEDKR